MFQKKCIVWGKMHIYTYIEFVCVSSYYYRYRYYYRYKSVNVTGVCMCVSPCHGWWSWVGDHEWSCEFSQSFANFQNQIFGEISIFSWIFEKQNFSEFSGKKLFMNFWEKKISWIFEKKIFANFREKKIGDVPFPLLQVV